ncbi:hypothetical protein NQZ68_004710 [Dissostichus eleginoides]|nr:hypothetical protein NQZ68_004710 [Dissostichus eleginoides]
MACMEHGMEELNGEYVPCPSTLTVITETLRAFCLFSSFHLLSLTHKLNGSKHYARCWLTIPSQEHMVNLQSWTCTSLIGCGLSSFPLFLASFQYFPSSCNPFRGSLVHSRREKHSRGIEEQKAGTHVTPTASTVECYGSDSAERRDNPSS